MKTRIFKRPDIPAITEIKAILHNSIIALRRWYESVAIYPLFLIYFLLFYSIAIMLVLGQWKIARRANFLCCYYAISLCYAIKYFWRMKASPVCSLKCWMYLWIASHYPLVLYTLRKDSSIHYDISKTASDIDLNLTGSLDLTVTCSS